MRTDHPVYRQELAAVRAAAPSLEPLRGRTVLITGATGLVGAFLTDALALASREEGLELKLVAVSRDAERARARFAEWDSVRAISMDLTRPGKLPEADFIVHAAANAHPAAFSADPVGTMLGNFEGVRALLEQLLAPGQYLENAAIPEDSQTRVEFAVRLPAADGEALLPIDSKFPQEDFLRLTEAAQSGDAAQTAACAARLERALREQAKQISTKYIRPPQTADFAVMFLPVESLYAEAVRIPGLCERLQNEYRVLVAGPNTLAALLTSLRMGFRTVSLERRSGEVLRALTKIQSEFEACEQSARQVRQRLAQAADALDALDARNRKFARALRELSDGEDGE